MPAVSQQQQKIMGLALSVKRGDTPRSEVSDDVLNIVDSMSEKDLEKYAGTEHTGLPKTVEAKIREMVRELYKEMKSVNEGKFKVDDLVYNKRTKTVGIVRMGDDRHGEVKTDADGNVSVDELEKYNPIKFKHQSKAKVAPSTEKEINSRRLFNPFKAESVVNEIANSKGYKPKDAFGARIIQAIDTNIKESVPKNLKGQGLSNEEILKYGTTFLQVVRNGIKAAFQFKYKIHPDVDFPMRRPKDKYWRFDSREDMEKYLKVFLADLKKLDSMIASYLQKPTLKAQQQITDFWNWDIMVSSSRTGGFADGVMKSDTSKQSFYESVNEEKVVTKKEWDRIHKDFKGMVNGKPHMMYLDPKTDKTVYGPVTIKESITELTVSRIPNLNLESDSYIHMLDVLKNNSTFKKIVSTAGMDLYSGANSKNVFNVLKQNLKKVLSPQIISSVVSKVNQKRERLSIGDTDIQSGKYSERFAGILALGLIDSFMDTPVDTKLIKDLGNSKLATMAKEFSINRGKGKVSAMMANRNNESITEAKFNKGDLVRVIDRPKHVWDKQFWGKSGYIKGVMGKDILVTFPNGRTIVVDAKDIELNKD